MFRRVIGFLLAVVFLGYLGVLLCLTVFRPGFWTHTLCSGVIHFNPWSTLAGYAHVHAWHTFGTEVVGNLLCLVPLGLYLAWLRCRFWTAAVFGFLLSFAIETSQFVLGSGVAETSDVILNTCGAILGWCAWMLIA